MVVYFFPYPFVLGIILLSIFLFYSRKKHSKPYLFFFSLFWIYLLFLIGLTLFPIPSFTYPLHRAEFTHILSRINWLPFRIGSPFPVYFIIPDVIGNILATIPFGFGIPFLKRIRPGEMVLFSLIGLVIELSQLMISLYLAMAYRTVDITDVITNCIGVWLGYGLFRGFAWLYANWKDKPGNSQTGFSKYLSEVTRQL